MLPCRAVGGGGSRRDIQERDEVAVLAMSLRRSKVNDVPMPEIAQ